MVIPAGDSQAFSVAARDPEGAALNYSWFLDDNLVSSGSSWTFATTDADLGRHTLVCEVADALWTNGQVYAEWDISVGQKLYVNAVTGTTNGTGTAESPFKTLQQAEEELGVPVIPVEQDGFALWDAMSGLPAAETEIPEKQIQEELVRALGQSLGQILFLLDRRDLALDLGNDPVVFSLIVHLDELKDIADVRTRAVKVLMPARSSAFSKVRTLLLR